GAVGTTSLISSALQFMVLMGTALVLNWVAALSVGAFSIFMFGALRPLRRAGKRSTRALSRAQIAYARGIAESNRVAEESHVFDARAAQRANLYELIATAQRFYYRAQVLLRLVANLYQSVIFLLLMACLAVLYLVGGNHDAALSGVLLLLIRAGQTGQSAQSSYQTIIQSLPFIERIQNTLQRYRDNSERYGDQRLDSISTVDFEDVGFSYGTDTQTLSGVSFAVRGGEAIGIVGPSGAGKSTLVQLLLRLRDPMQGEYLVNGEPAAGFSSEDWHRKVSYVPQDPQLLHASVADNIRFFREIPMDEVERAAKLARIHDDIMSWPGGYEAIVGPRADAVSGGQQQRI
ncbi:MAG TPA: ABC transporter ATP-binding protein, partial [Polyangiales bacterium]|nr:ABC transporter ATP-binding protein [Polyangiales bacterium]